MDHSGHSQPPTSASPQTSRKRAFDSRDESPTAKDKREKARERQRRKRERDRAGMMVMSFPPPPAEAPIASTSMSAPQQLRQHPADVELTPEELSRRDRVRAAARERQRKHRALVKQRKLQELGLDMGNEVLNDLDQYRQTISASQFDPLSISSDSNVSPGMFGDGSDGHTFASTLLLSLSCSPLLKQHVTRTLSMTTDDLTSFEPILAHAWTQWDKERRKHFPKQAGNPHANEGTEGQSGSGDKIPSLPYSVDPNGTSPEDFRARFHRSLITPSPFLRTTEEGIAASPRTLTVSSRAPTTQIDPHLTTPEDSADRPGDSDTVDKGQEEDG